MEKTKFVGLVTEIIGGDAIIVKLRTGETKKVFLAFVKSPRSLRKNLGFEKLRRVQTLFDAPWLFEAREFLRTKLIGETVDIVIEFKLPPISDGPGRSFPEKLFCTVLIGGVNIAEQLVLNGFATVYLSKSQNSKEKIDQISDLITAENKAKVNHVGLHCEGEPPKRDLIDCVGSRDTANQLFQSLEKGSKIDAIVECVTSGSKMNLLVQKEFNWFIITFFLSGISCPQSTTSSTKKAGKTGDPCGDEAFHFTKEKILQRKVSIQIKSVDTFGNMIGSLFFGETDIALALIKQGLANVHQSCSNMKYIQAAKVAKNSTLNMWKNQSSSGHEHLTEYDSDYEDITVVNVTSHLHFYAHHVEEKMKLLDIERNLKYHMEKTPPACCSKLNLPQIGKLCAAKFTDNEWYRCEVEGVSSEIAVIKYIDYGNRRRVPFNELAPLPKSFEAFKPFAHQYGLACVQASSDKRTKEIINVLNDTILNENLLIKIQYEEKNLPYVTIVDPNSGVDPLEELIRMGFLEVNIRDEQHLQTTINSYLAAQITHLKKKSDITVLEEQVSNIQARMDLMESRNNEKIDQLQRSMDILLVREVTADLGEAALFAEEIIHKKPRTDDTSASPNPDLDSASLSTPSPSQQLTGVASGTPDDEGPVALVPYQNSAEAAQLINNKKLSSPSW